MTQRTSRLRLVVLASFAILPSFLKRAFYRWFFGYRVGKRVRIGLSIIDARECEIDDDVSIGHLNVVTRVQKLVIKDHMRIGHLNIIRGGDLVSLGRYSEIIRLNEINSIPDPEVVNPIDGMFVPPLSQIPAGNSAEVDPLLQLQFGNPPKADKAGKDDNFRGVTEFAT